MELSPDFDPDRGPEFSRAPVEAHDPVSPVFAADGGSFGGTDRKNVQIFLVRINKIIMAPVAAQKRVN